MKEFVPHRCFAILSAIVLLPLASYAEMIIVSDSFTDPDATPFADHRPDTNLPGGTYTSNVPEYWGNCFISNEAAQLSTDSAEFISIVSAGSYVKPLKMSVSINFNMGTVTGSEEEAAYGAGLGFYPDGATPRLHSPTSFTGIIVSPETGNLKLFSNEVLIQTLPYKGSSWDAGIEHSLSYTVDTVAGSLSNVVMDGTNYNFDETDVFTDEITANVGFLVSSSQGGKIGWFDNLRVVGDPAPAKEGNLNADKAISVVASERMQQVYDEVKTPFKYGVVIRGETGQLVDSPSIFRQNDQWYMVYIGITDGIGYETFLARSPDLLHWEKMGKILSFRPDGWDRWQVDGGIALCDPTWGGSSELQTFDGKYWMSYIGGALQGYETDPLAIGIAWSTTPTEVREWTSIAENPVLTRNQSDVRAFEKETLYKSQIIWDKAQTLGAPFVMYYNGKLKSGYEQIGMAVSADMIHWKRYGAEAVVANGEDNQNGISGDPQIVRMGDLWVMFYFGAYWKPNAFDTFACSNDLVHWTKWNGPHLTEPSETFDEQYAHKPWLIKHDGVVYHFYCAVGDQGRVIALATSKDFKNI